MTEVSAHSAGYEEVPRVWPFNATHKLGPDVRELLSMHCSWCVLDCGEAQVGKDYSAAPTCATCHMSATSTQPVTHDVGDRISYTLRPAISIHQKDWEKKRSSMQDVCSNCHATGWIENFYKQYDNTIDLYNDKFAKPAKSIMDKLYAANKLTKTPFDEKIEWTYYEMCTTREGAPAWARP